MVSAESHSGLDWETVTPLKATRSFDRARIAANSNFNVIRPLPEVPLGRIKAEMAELNSTSVQRKERKLSIFYWQMLGKVSIEK